MDAILLTGGASVGTPASSLPLDISRLKCNLFGCKNRDERTSGPNAPNYSEKVLVGNWFERRSVCRRPTDEWITVYSAHYKPHGINDSIEDVYNVWKNKQNTQGTDRPPMIDGHSYLNNMTTVYDLNYRILPKSLCGPKIRVYKARKSAWVPEADLTLSYGNQTKYGLVDAVKAKQDHYNGNGRDAILPWKSIYTIDYDEPVVADPGNIKIKRFPKLRGDMNTPDLRHLGITLVSTTKLPAREPQYRSFHSNRICTSL